MTNKSEDKKTKMKRVRGTLIYPKLIVADTKFKKEGEYIAKVRVADSATGIEDLIREIDEAAAASLEAAREKAKTPAERKKWETKYLPYTRLEDDEGNPTGEVEFKATMKASGTTKEGKPWKMQPKLFDAKGKPIVGKAREALFVGNGSVAIVCFTLVPYAPTTQVGASVKLSLEAVQLIDVKSGGARASDYGFGEEDGFSSDDIDASDVGDDNDQDEDTDAEYNADEEDF